MAQNIREYGLSSGRMLKEDSVIINQADYLEAERQASVVQASRDGTLFRGWFQGSIAGATTHWFVLLPPPGLVVYGESRIVDLEEGEIRVQFYQGGTLGATVGSPLPARNFNQVDGVAPQSVLQQYDDVTGSTAMSPNKLITAPTTGPRLVPSNQTEVGANVRLSDEKFAAFRVRNDTGATAAYTLFLTWQELP